MDWTDIYASRQNRTVLTASVTGVEEFVLNNNPFLCLVMQDGDTKGLIPLPESGIEPGPNKYATINRLMNFLNQEIAFVVIGIDRENNLYVASRKQALEKLSSRTWQFLKPDQIRNAIVRRYYKTFTPEGREKLIGIIVEIDGIEGILPSGEISHGFTEDLPQPGEEIQVKIIKADPENKKLVVSRKALLPDPWPACTLKYKKGGTYMGTVTGIAEYGVFINFEPGVSALCKHPKAGKVSPGDKVAVTVISVDPQKKRITGAISRIVFRAG